MESEWQPINTAPHDFDEKGHFKPLQLRNARTGQEWRGRRTFWNDSGWCEIGSGREIWPTHWRPHEDEGSDKPA